MSTKQIPAVNANSLSGLSSQNVSKQVIITSCPTIYSYLKFKVGKNSVFLLPLSHRYSEIPGESCPAG